MKRIEVIANIKKQSLESMCPLGKSWGETLLRASLAWYSRTWTKILDVSCAS